jgi:hypothetical protein
MKMSLKFTLTPITKLHVFFIVGLYVFSFQLTAQQVILKEPQFPEPEDELLYFVQEDFVFNTNAYQGQISHIDRVYTEYNSNGNPLGTNTEINQPTKKYIINKKISKHPILDYLDVKTIKKVKRKTFELEVLDSINYENLIYTLKESVITKRESEFDEESIYIYNEMGQLVKTIKDNGYEGENIEIGTYNSKGQIIEYKSFDTRDGLSVYVKAYIYNTLGLLIQVKEEEAYYHVPWYEIEEETKNPIDVTDFDYKKYLNDNSQITEKTIDLKYNVNNQLVEVDQKYHVYSKDGSAYFDPADYNNFNFNITYGVNTLIVEAVLPSKRMYEYTFDHKKNPINIKSYVVTDSGKWLHKETVLNIVYNKL